MMNSFRLVTSEKVHWKCGDAEVAGRGGCFCLGKLVSRVYVLEAGQISWKDLWLTTACCERVECELIQYARQSRFQV